MTHKPICPKCKSDRVASILWGLPANEEMLRPALDAGKIVFGGCCIPAEPAPEYRCLDCNHEFSRSHEFPKSQRSIIDNKP